MRTLNHTIYYPSRSDTFKLVYFTDTHVGARACAEDLLKRDIQAVANDPNTYWIFGGDSIDCIARKGDRRYNESSLSKWLRGKDDVIGMQRDYWLDLFKPIAGKCLGMIEGNHERASLDHTDRNVYWELVTLMAKEANRPPHELALGYQGFVCIKFRRGTKESFGSSWTLTLYAHHGYGGGRLPGGHALTLGRTMSDYEADLILMGHRHVRAFVDKTIVLPNFRSKLRMAMFVPSYLNCYIKPSSEDHLTDTYAETLSLPPQHLGAIPITITPNRQQFDVTLSNTPGISVVEEQAA